MLIRLIVLFMLLLAVALFIFWKLAPGPEERSRALGLPTSHVTAAGSCTKATVRRAMEKTCVAPITDHLCYIPITDRNTTGTLLSIWR